jgi:hypothetical protein
MNSLFTFVSGSRNKFKSAKRLDLEASRSIARENRNAAYSDFIHYQLKCDIADAELETSAIKVRISKNCQNISKIKSIDEITIENKNSHFIATIFKNETSGNNVEDFSSDFIPLEIGQNNIEIKSGQKKTTLKVYRK